MKDVANAPEIKRLESMREMQPYNNPTRAMFIGAPGKLGFLRPEAAATATNRISRCAGALLAMSQQEQRPRLLK